MTPNNTETAISIKQILSEDKYIIPLYQRNYAWEKAEIVQLINDIKDSKQNESNYYLGSLVCFKRADDTFELIDGQQRHTTLTLINLVLKSISSVKHVNQINLYFDARPNNNSYLNLLLITENIEKAIQNDSEAKVDSFKTAMQIIKEELKEFRADELKSFSEYFYNKVMLFRVEVPKDTDLNHYFEIMNNRGEQLEKHEILKSLLMGKIKGDDKQVKQVVFAKIWDSCSDMTDYTCKTFTSNNDFRSKVFSAGELNSQNFESFIQIIEEVKRQKTKEDDSNNIFDAIEYKNDGEEIDQGKNINQILVAGNLICNENTILVSEKYKSVIDFPNFLLQVLKLHLKNKDVSFDDKNLLKEFKEKEIQPEEFIFDLLRFRTLFDKIIIKQDLSNSNENENWSIRTFRDSEIRRTFENKGIELIMIQSMLHYSNPANNYKNWLFELLQAAETKKEYEDLVSKCNEISKARFQFEKLSYPNITTFNLYYIDFLIWKEYDTKVKGKNKETFENELLNKIDKKKNLFNTFKFRQLNSKEHLFSQSKKDMIVGDNKDDILNSLGNLCLISNGENSSANNNSPLDKKHYYGDKNTSLKRLIMFESFENDTWNTKQIQGHTKEILDLLQQYKIMKDKKTPFTEAEISALFREREIDVKYFKRFYDYYIECFKEIYEDESKNCNEEDLEEIGDYSHTSALSVTDMYIEIFLKEKALNHGDEWAHAVAHSEEENENTYGCAYDDLNKSNPDLAKKELLILCKSHGGDEYFEKKFIQQFEDGHGYTGCTERARSYSEIYKNKLAQGKSKVYAHEYAELIARGDDHPIYCEEFAYAYDKAISNGKNEEYAYIYADMYGEVLVDIKRRAGIHDDEDLIDFNIEKVNAYMNAWEYYQENKLKDFDRFASIYENIYLNTYFADDGWPEGSKEDIDKGILKKALKTFN